MKKKDWDEKENCYNDFAEFVQNVLKYILKNNTIEKFEEWKKLVEKWEKLIMYIYLAIEREVECFVPFDEIEKDFIPLSEEKRQMLREEVFSLLRGEKEINDEFIRGTLNRIKKNKNITEKDIKLLMTRIAWYYFAPPLFSGN
ncbi:MAG: hypothetical protein QW228_08885 [Candidatus Aenigmatarchaeota archaeon]